MSNFDSTVIVTKILEHLCVCEWLHIFECERVNEKPLRYNGSAPTRSGLALLDLWQPYPIT